MERKTIWIFFSRAISPQRFSVFLSYRCPYDFKRSCYKDFSVSSDFSKDRPTGADRRTGKLREESVKRRGNYLDFFWEPISPQRFSVFLSYRCPYDFKRSCYKDFSVSSDFSKDRPTGADRRTGKLREESVKRRGNYLDFFWEPISPQRFSVFLSYRYPYDFKRSCYEDFRHICHFFPSRPTGVDRNDSESLLLFMHARIAISFCVFGQLLWLKVGKEPDSMHIAGCPHFYVVRFLVLAKLVGTAVVYGLALVMLVII